MPPCFHRLPSHARRCALRFHLLPPQRQRLTRVVLLRSNDDVDGASKTLSLHLHLGVDAKFSSEEDSEDEEDKDDVNNVATFSVLWDIRTGGSLHGQKIPAGPGANRPPTAHPPQMGTAFHSPSTAKGRRLSQPFYRRGALPFAEHCRSPPLPLSQQCLAQPFHGPSVARHAPPLTAL